LRVIFWCSTVIDHAALLTTMNAMTLDKWIPFRNEGPAVRCRLLCFPHAGGNATFYRPIRHLMPPEVDFCPVELPGRAARLDELVPFGFFLATAWVPLWPLKPPGNCARSMAETAAMSSRRCRLQACRQNGVELQANRGPMAGVPGVDRAHYSCWSDGLSSLRPFPNCLQSDACGSSWIGKSQLFRSN
jgi:hypothetical protein